MGTRCLLLTLMVLLLAGCSGPDQVLGGPQPGDPGYVPVVAPDGVPGDHVGFTPTAGADGLIPPDVDAVILTRNSSCSVDLDAQGYGIQRDVPCYARQVYEPNYPRHAFTWGPYGAWTSGPWGSP